MSALPSRLPYSGRLTFDEEHHAYHLDGERIPGITSVLKRVGILDDGFYSIEARDRGSWVHLAIQFLGEGCLERSSVAPTLMPYVEAWERWADEMRWEPIEVPECLVGSETLRYATRIDGVGRFQGDPRICVGNWKTGGAEEWHAIQSAGETLAYAETVGRASTLALRRFALYLRPDGTYRFHEHPTKTAQRDVDDFRAAVRTFHAINRIGPRARKES